MDARLAADQGKAEAQFALGLMYNEGEGVAQSKEEAVKWCRLAADQLRKGRQMRNTTSESCARMARG